MGLPIWARWIRVRGADKDVPGTIDVPVIVGGARIAAGRHRSCSTPTASPWSRRSASTRCSRPSRAREEKERVQAREAAGRRALLRPRRPARASVEMRATSPTSATSSCSPRSRSESLALLRRRARHGDRGARRPVGLPARLGRLPALLASSSPSPTAPASRTWRCARWQRRGARAPGRRDRGQRASARLDRRRPRPRPRLPLPRPRRPRLRALLREPSATSRPTTCKPSLRNQPQRYTGRGAAVKRLDHVNLLAADVARLPRVRHRRARLPPLRGHRARRRQRGRRLAEPRRSPPTS